MSSQQIIICLLLLTTITLSSIIVGVNTITPVGPRIANLKNSWTIGNSNTASVNFEMFLDLTCPDCSTHFQTITKPLVQYYFNNGTSPTNSDKVTLTLHLMPLPMHIAGFYSAQTYSIVTKYAKADRNICWKFLDGFFSNQSPASNANLKAMNQSQIFNLLYATYVRPLDLISYDQYLNEMNSQSSFVAAASMFGYATSRGLYGTPFFFVNGVNVFNGYDFSASDWISMIDGIIKSN